MPTQLSSRQEDYFKLNTQLSLLSNLQITQQLKTSSHTQGWGLNHHLEIAGRPVFVKRIPLTALEHTRLFDTRNHFQLPMYYHYGVGSAGFGAFRELLVHIKTNNWVLQDKCAHFPLLYHYRIMESTAPWKHWEPEPFKQHLRYWNNSKRIGTYLQARKEAPYEIALFLESVPYSLHSWFEAHPSKNIRSLFAQCQQALAFLQQQGVLHLDAHLANILTDGQQIFVSDFGLALDQEWNLNANEKAFFENHQNYDQGELISCLGYLLRQQGKALQPKNRLFQADPSRSPVEQLQQQLSQLDSIKIPAQLKILLKQYQPTLILMATFFESLRKHKKQTGLYNDLALSQTLLTAEMAGISAV